jgi:hypothetical protein
MSSRVVVENSSLITTREEAVLYYRTKLARAHAITVRESKVTIVFERDATHLYSAEAEEPIADEHLVERVLGGGRSERRRFDVARAVLMDAVLPAISNHVFAIQGTGARGREKALVHGPSLGESRYMLVALRPGPGDAFTCTSAYVITQQKWLEGRRAKPMPFPPKKEGPA